MHTWCSDSESQGEGKGPAKGRLLNGYCMFLFVHVDGLLFMQGTGEGFHSFVIFHPSFIPEFVWKAYAWMDSGDEGDEGSEGQQLARARLTRSFT